MYGSQWRDVRNRRCEEAHIAKYCGARNRGAELVAVLRRFTCVARQSSRNPLGEVRTPFVKP